jgi:O-antigen/teichoic acid export membrane protein
VAPVIAIFMSRSNNLREFQNCLAEQRRDSRDSHLLWRRLLASHAFLHGANLNMLARLNSRGVRQGIWAIAEYFAYPLFMFAATPFFLRWLGEAQYGQWMLVLVFTGFGGLTGLGMGASAVKEVSAAAGRGDLEGAAVTTRVCLFVTLVSSFLFSALLLLGAYFFGERFFQRMGNWSDVWPLFTFASVLIFLEQIDQVFAGTIRGLQKFDLSARIEATAKLGTVVCAVLIAFLLHSLPMVLLVVTMLTICRMGTKAYFASQLLKRAVYFPLWNKVRALEIFSFGKWVWLQSMGSSIFSTADRLIVGSLLGSVDLARYSVCLQLAQQIQTLPAAGAQVLFPAISNRIGSGQNFRQLAIRGSLLVAAFVFVLGGGLWFFSGRILQAWVGADVALGSTPVLEMLTLAFVLLGINVGPHYGLYGMGRSGLVALINTVAGCLAVAIAIIAIQRFGLIGAAFARVGYGAFVCLDIVVFGRELQKRARVI